MNLLSLEKYCPMQNVTFGSHFLSFFQFLLNYEKKEEAKTHQFVHHAAHLPQGSQSRFDLDVVKANNHATKPKFKLEKHPQGGSVVHWMSSK